MRLFNLANKKSKQLPMIMQQSKCLYKNQSIYVIHYQAGTVN